MMFLPGDHVLDRNITVANVTRLTMRGESSSGNRATVVCNGSFFLIFTSMVDLKIHLLDFTSFTYHALSLQSAQRTELVNCSFHGNHGTALVVNNTDITLAGNIEFKRNHVRHRRRKQFHFEGAEHNIHCNTAICTACMNINKVSGVKYWVYAVGSNLTFTGNATFLGNSAGIVADHDNSGGAIYTQNTVLNFSGTTNFISNSAGESDGGAIYTSAGTIYFSGTTNFINNSASESDGGAIYTSAGTIYFSGTTNFINNSAAVGGAIYTSGLLSFSGTTNFINNSAYYSGGAIYADESKLSFNGTVNFINNICSVDVNEDAAGGGVYIARA